ncbi:hypothetical protein CHS0354_007964 [Potamilus streckersoni]|uniref:NADP-dependent oxidoreductase domain-containing protein n=1 Tax=Potamilus streckersoni TaxID=2493646 RepID=A0AAE0VSZ4_9BIVA|nr:hypothetical protein CHS0354_007964 [Potamilus streckersoni]
MPFPKMYVEGFHDSEAVAKMKYNILGRTGLETSFLSFGASALGSVFRPTNEEDSIEVVKYAVKSGINYIDTAPWYGHGKAETLLGKVLPELPRETYYLATKVGRYLPQAEQMFDFRAERVISSVDESLQRMGQEYVDVIQVHDMEFAPSLDVIINETLPALQKVKDSGKARFIGITGYPLENFRTVIDRSQVQIDIVLTYCRGALNDSSLLDYIPYFQEKGVGIINASPHGMGLLSPRGSAAWHPAHSDIKQACREAAQYCEEKGVDISRIAMDFALNIPGVHTTLFSTAR